jgi:hypothetical protein
MNAIAALSFDQARDLAGGKFGAVDAPCPLCGPHRRAANQNKKTLRLWCNDPAFITYHCVHCGEKGWTSDSAASRSTISVLSAAESATILAEVQRREQDEASERLKTSLRLWRQHQPLASSPAETYLRDFRGYTAGLPGTLGFLPAREDYPPAMIAAFGMAQETLPGELIIPDGAVRGVHLTRLAPSGFGKAGTDTDKVMIGRSIGFPIVLAPVNDGLGLSITEGIEDALSLHQATGLGAWAAGSASRLPALAERIPGYVEVVTIGADHDADGMKFADQLGQIVLRSRECKILVPA